MTVSEPNLRGGMVDGEFLLTTADFDAIADMLRADAGIALSGSKATLVYSRLAKRLRLLGLKTFSDYCRLVASPQGKEERGAMLAALTTNVTRFFREPHHFEHLRANVLPALVAQCKRGGKVRIWSSACSNGQEPYSIALTVLSVMPDAADYDIKILATDIDPNMVAEGSAGIYADSIVEAVPAALRRSAFTVVPERPGFQRVSENLRRLVRFRQMNLIGNWPMHGRFAAIFCRNVVIYFEEATQSRLWTRMVPLLEPDGVLYIGHSERVSGLATERLRTDGLTTYRLASDEGRVSR